MNYSINENFRFISTEQSSYSCNILAIGDPHFKTDNINESKKFIKELDYFIDHYEFKINYIVVLGDILHTHEKLHTHALNIAVDFFTLLTDKVKQNIIDHIYILIGNHDATNNTIFLNQNHWMNILKKWDYLTIVDYPLIIDNQFILCPYVPDGKFIDALKLVFEDKWKTKKLIFAHQTFNNAKMGAIVAKGVDEWEEHFPLCISGHIHDKQKIKNNLFYTGSSMQHGFGDNDDKSLALIKIIDYIIIVEDLFLNLPKKKIIYTDIENIEKSIEKIQQNKNENISYKIVIKDNEEEYKSFKQTSKFKEIEKINEVKSIAFKKDYKSIIEKENLLINNSKNINTSENELLNNLGESDDFINLLVNIVLEENDPYLQKLCESILTESTTTDEDIIII